MPLTIVRQDITRMKVDAIVNAANTDLRMGGGVCGAIFQAAGPERMQAACDRVAPIPTGGAAITRGFDLPARYVIHAAGPVYSPGNEAQCRELLRSAYTESMKLAERKGCRSIAFPLISSGIYGYPKDKALEVARLAIEDYLREHDLEVSLVVYDKSSFLISEALLGKVESYIDQHYVDLHFAEGESLRSVSRNLLDVERDALSAPPPMAAAPPMPAASPAPSARRARPFQGRRLDKLVDNLDEPFSQALLKLIDAKGKKDTEVYKRANIDRKLFSKIRHGRGYTPKKPTILALAIALELTLPETEMLLKRAGYALSHASKFDVIVEYFIISGNYDIFQLNEVLFSYDQPLLGG